MRIAIDTETTSLWPHRIGTDGNPGRCRLVQFWNDDLRAVYDLDIPKDKQECYELLFKVTEGFFFNVGFDKLWLEHTFGPLPHIRWCDAGYVRAAKKGGGTFDLKTLAKWDLNEELNKNVRSERWDGELTEEQYDYALKDAEVTWGIVQKNWNESHWVFQNVIPAVEHMQRAGLYMDRQAHQVFCDRVVRGEEGAARWLQEHIQDMNWNSGKQLSEFLKEYLPEGAYRRWPRTKTGMLQTDAETLKKFIPAVDYPLTRALAILLLLKKRRTYNSFFGPSLQQKLHEDGRIRSSYRIAGAKTGRFSCVNPNSQQFPSAVWFRNMFIAPNGRVIIVADFSQIELRIVAEIAGDEMMREIFASGGDIHAATAEKMFGLNWTKDHRRAAKIIGFGMLYGKGVGSLSAELGVSVEEGERFLSSWLGAFPGINSWYKTLRHVPAQTVLGRRIPLERGRESTTQKNYPIQGSAADLMLDTLTRLHNFIDESRGDLICASVHDEVVMEVDIDRAPIAIDMLESAMRDSWSCLFPNAPTTGVADAFADSSWGRAKH